MKPDWIEIGLLIALPVSFFWLLKVVYDSGKESGKEAALEAAQKEIEELKSAHFTARVCCITGNKIIDGQKSELEQLTAALKVAEDALEYMTEDFDCPAEDVAIYDMRKAKEALAKIQKIKKGLG